MHFKSTARPVHAPAVTRTIADLIGGHVEIFEITTTEDRELRTGLWLFHNGEAIGRQQSMDELLEMARRERRGHGR